MKTEMTDNLINEMILIVRDSKEFVLDYAPQVVVEIYKWNVLLCSIGIGFGILALIIAISAFFLVSKYKNGEGAAPLFIGIISLIASIFFLSINITNLLQINMAPKLFLIEYLRNMR